MILDLDPNKNCDEEVLNPPSIQFNKFPVDVPIDTGNDCAKKVEEAINDAHLQGKVVLIPICDGDCSTDGGNNGKYHIVRIAAFFLDYISYDEQPQQLGVQADHVAHLRHADDQHRRRQRQLELHGRLVRALRDLGPGGQRPDQQRRGDRRPADPLGARPEPYHRGMRDGRRARSGGGVTAGLAQLRGYSGGWFRADLLAGITVTAYLVPQCLAYADLAGVEPVTGLWVAVVAMVAYALLGTSRQLSVGPESATAVMVAPAVAPLAGGDPARYAALAAGLALLVGLVCIAAFVLRLGFLADLLSQPILVGYMAGVALIMIGSQLATITGVTLSSDGVRRPRSSSCRATSATSSRRRSPSASASPRSCSSSSGVAPLAPGSLIAVVGAAVIVYVFDLTAYGIALVGPVPSGLPVDLAAGPRDRRTSRRCSGPPRPSPSSAYTDVALTGRAFAVRTGEVIDANREFLALGSPTSPRG